MKSYNLLLAFVAAVLAATLISSTPLDEYINAPDPAFAFSYTGHSFDGLDYTAYIWNLTSQQWLTSAESDRSVWWHHVAVIIPKDMDPDYESKAFMYITGGDNNNPNSFPDDKDEDIFVTATIAVAARMPAAVLFQVPNQPITFTNDPWHQGGRSEDAAIALTWWQFLQDPSNPNVVLELPMTKSGVSALNMLDQVIPKYTKTGKPMQRYAVGGASKRGWTTWLMMAADKRVGAGIPIVLDALHVHDFFHRHWKSYGAWSFALVDYYNCNITRLVDTAGFKQLMSFVDPYYYFNRYANIPILVVNAVGDEFQLVDDWRYWMHDATYANVPAPRSQIRVKNAEHSLATGVIEVLTSVSAWAEAYLGNKKRIPQFTWNISADGTINIQTDGTPVVAIDVAVGDSALGVSAGRRDFRWAAIENPCPSGVELFGGCLRPLLWWTSDDSNNAKYITKHSETSYSAIVPLPPAGQWRAFMIELRFANPYTPEIPYYFTSGASVIPDTYPFPDCSGNGCYGTLC